MEKIGNTDPSVSPRAMGSLRRSLVSGGLRSPAAEGKAGWPLPWQCLAEAAGPSSREKRPQGAS